MCWIRSEKGGQDEQAHTHSTVYTSGLRTQELKHSQCPCPYQDSAGKVFNRPQQENDNRSQFNDQNHATGKECRILVDVANLVEYGGRICVR